MDCKDRINHNPHIVETYHFDGCTVHIASDSYENKTEEELEAIREHARSVAREIFRKAALAGKEF